MIGFGGTVVVARLLAPHDFGIVALGLSIVMVIGVLLDGGLGAGLIRRDEPPAPEELQALTALQVVVAVASTLFVAAAAVPFGEIGWVAALMVSSTPLVALQFPGRILLERSLSYRPLVAVEISQVVAYHGWAVAAVVAGFGVWGLATATLARAAAGTLLMAVVSPVGLVRPRFSWQRIRSLIAFGLRFQATSATWLVRDQGLGVAIAAVASVATLGLWSLAKRLLEIPYLLLGSLWRVSYPAMSQVVAANDAAAPLIERAVGMAAVGTGVLLTGLAGSAPGLIPGVFGEQWGPASNILPGACLGLGIAGPVSVATQGFLYAVGDASAVLRAVVLHTIALFAVTLPLLPALGMWAVALGLLVSFLVEAVALGRATRRWTQVRLLHPLSGPVVVGVVSGALGWLVSDLGGANLLSGIVGGLCSVICFAAGLLAFRRQLLLETFRFSVRSMQAAASREPAPGAA